MAVGTYNFNENTRHGAHLREALTHLENGLRVLNQVADNLPLMVDNELSGDARYQEIVARYGFTDGATALAAYQAITGVLGKLNSDASVTGVASAMKELFDRLR
jgi:hypothetical protein